MCASYVRRIQYQNEAPALWICSSFWSLGHFACSFANHPPNFVASTWADFCYIGCLAGRSFADKSCSDTRHHCHCSDWEFLPAACRSSRPELEHGVNRLKSNLTGLGAINEWLQSPWPQRWCSSCVEGLASLLPLGPWSEFERVVRRNIAISACQDHCCHHSHPHVPWWDASISRLQIELHVYRWLLASSMCTFPEDCYRSIFLVFLVVQPTRWCCQELHCTYDWSSCQHLKVVAILFLVFLIRNDDKDSLMPQMLISHDLLLCKWKSAIWHIERSMILPTPAARHGCDGPCELYCEWCSWYVYMCYMCYVLWIIWMHQDLTK